MSAETIAQRLLDTAQMRSQFPEWLCNELEQAADAIRDLRGKWADAEARCVTLNSVRRERDELRASANRLLRIEREAQSVVRWDWSENDDDCVADVDRLRDAVNAL